MLEFIGEFESALPGAVARVLVGVGLVGLVEQLLDLYPQAFLVFLHALVRHRLVLARIGFDLRTVYRHMAELDQSRFLAQQQHRYEQCAEVLTVHSSKFIEAREVRTTVASKNSKRDVFLDRPLEPT